MQLFRVARDPIALDLFDDASGRCYFFFYLFSLLAIPGSQAREIVVVTLPLRRDVEHHVGFGFEFAIRETRERGGGVGVRIGNVFDHHERRVAKQLIDTTQAIDRFGNRGPERLVVHVWRE